jgi:alanine racemase
MTSGRPLIWAEIDLAAVAENTRALRRHTIPRAQVMAVVKADGYGHGAVPVARTALANGAGWLGVARCGEGVRLREAGIGAPILVFGYTPPDAAEELLEFDLRQAVHSVETAAAYSALAARRGKRLRVHLKVDTGMGRLGLLPAVEAAGGRMDRAFAGAAESIARLPGIDAEGIFTHLASADSAELAPALRQLERFSELLDALAANGLVFPVRHAANSAALIALPRSHLDLVRPGIALYGLAPSEEMDLSAIRLRPAMALKTRIIHLKDVPAGFAVSYGMTYRTPAPTRIATVPAGYADGYRRSFSSRGQMLVQGRRVPVVGRVCMDLTMLDVGGVPEVRLEDEVVVFGRQGDEEIPAGELARALRTIPYEIVCNVAARVPRTYPAPPPPAA